MKKTNIFTLLFLLGSLFGTTQLFSQTHHSRYVPNYHIEQDLDLNAVSSLFGESRDLYDFERRLNDPYYRISNLDLNHDGYVDYLRVFETVDGRFHFIVIQAILGNRRYQDIATIEVYRNHHETYVHVIGNRYIYGPNYIIEPVFFYRPEIFTLFWRPKYYHPYYSQFRWRRYPPHYKPWHPVPVPDYERHIRKHINHHNRYKHTHHSNNIRTSRSFKHKHIRNDYAQQYPEKSYTYKKNHPIHIKKRDHTKVYKQKGKTKKSITDRYRKRGNIQQRSLSGRKDIH